MKTPIVKYSDKFLNSISWFMNIGGITLWPFVILREYYQKNTNYWVTKREKTINHESIHIKQQEELLIIPFYVLYITEWFIKLFFYGKKAYYNISFEREAYANENDYEYLKNRRFWAWLKYL